jgi:hypothetical protein
MRNGVKSTRQDLYLTGQEVRLITFSINVGCRHLTAPRYTGTYTTCYPEYCSENIKDLSDKADEVSKAYDWRRCKDCFKKLKLG